MKYREKNPNIIYSWWWRWDVMKGELWVICTEMYIDVMSCVIFYSFLILLSSFLQWRFHDTSFDTVVVSFLCNFYVFIYLFIYFFRSLVQKVIDTRWLGVWKVPDIIKGPRTTIPFKKLRKWSVSSPVRDLLTDPHWFIPFFVQCLLLQVSLRNNKEKSKDKI